MKKIIIILLSLNTLVGCGNNTAKLQTELDTLRLQPPAKSAAGAELAYNKAATLAAKITKEKKAPQDLLDSVAALRVRRATEWKSIAIKERAIGSAWKVFRALQESGASFLPDFKSEWNWGLGDEKLQSSAPAESLEGVDPTRDTPASELLKGGKK